MTLEADRVSMDGASGQLAELYKRHSGAAFHLAYLITGDRELARDLVQDAFVRLIGRFADLRKFESFDAYLKRTVVNLSYDQLRRRRVARAYLARREHIRIGSNPRTPRY